MKGEGIRADFTVTESDDEPVDRAPTTRRWSTRPRPTTRRTSRTSPTSWSRRPTEFVDLYKSGDDDAARTLYADARVHWERIETVAESFGDLDPMMDAREADLEPGQEWTGWHRIEKDLWPAAGGELHAPHRRGAGDVRRRPARQDDQTLNTRVQELTYTVDQIANGSRGLLEEVATRQGHRRGGVLVAHRPVGLPGQRRRRQGRLRRRPPIVEQKDPDLAEELDTRFAELQTLLDSHRVGEGFKYYDELTPDEVKALSDAVNALSEPLSRLTAAVLS